MVKIKDADALRMLDDLDPAEATVRDRSAVAGIEDAVRRRSDAEGDVEAEVVKARAAGVTWTEIGAALGVSHQAAIKRYRDRVATS